jgi:hypothetical protein
MSDVIKAARPDKSAKSNRNRLINMLANISKKTPAGAKFAGRMRFDIGETANSGDRELDVGLRKQDRSKGSWRRIFADWQEAGPVTVSGLQSGSMRRYFGAIGMPLRAGTMPRRPARPVIEKVERANRPAELFEKLFLERLLK